MSVVFFVWWWRGLRERWHVSALALEWTILTAARTGETVGARWEEIDGDVWTIPASRMKAGREHRVPLCRRCREILDALRPIGGAYVFPAQRRRDQPLSNMAMTMVLRQLLPGARVTVHGFRSTFRDWAGDETHFPRELVEEALAHVVGSAVERAYRRSDALDKRRRLMDAWAGYLGADAGAKVVRLRR